MRRPRRGRLGDDPASSASSSRSCRRTARTSARRCATSAPRATAPSARSTRRIEDIRKEIAPANSRGCAALPQPVVIQDDRTSPRQRRLPAAFGADVCEVASRPPALVVVLVDLHAARAPGPARLPDPPFGHGRLQALARRAPSRRGRAPREPLPAHAVAHQPRLRRRASAPGCAAIGVPSPRPLWGLLAAILRFIPYVVGPFAGAAAPLLVACARRARGLDAAAARRRLLFLVLEPFTNLVLETLIFLRGRRRHLAGRATRGGGVLDAGSGARLGLASWRRRSPSASPAALGRHAPASGLSPTLLSDDPVPEPPLRFYSAPAQAGDQEEAAEVLAAPHLKSPDASSPAYDAVVIPALALRRALTARGEFGSLDEERDRHHRRRASSSTRSWPRRSRSAADERDPCRASASASSATPPRGDADVAGAPHFLGHVSRRLRRHARRASTASPPTSPEALQPASASARANAAVCVADPAVPARWRARATSPSDLRAAPPELAASSNRPLGTPRAQGRAGHPDRSVRRGRRPRRRGRSTRRPPSYASTRRPPRRRAPTGRARRACPRATIGPRVLAHGTPGALISTAGRRRPGTAARRPSRGRRPRACVR